MIYEDLDLTNLETTISADVDLDIDERAIILAPFEGVTRITVLHEETVGGSAIGEQDQHLMN